MKGFIYKAVLILVITTHINTSAFAKIDLDNKTQQNKIITSLTQKIEHLQAKNPIRIYEQAIQQYHKNPTNEHAVKVAWGFDELEPSQQNYLEKEHFYLLAELGAKYRINYLLFTSYCWSALKLHKMELAKNVCTHSYKIDYESGEDIVNLGHIKYYQGKTEEAKNFYLQGLLTGGNTDFLKREQADFDILTNLYSHTQAREIKHYLQQSWQDIGQRYATLTEQEINFVQEKNWQKGLETNKKRLDIIAEALGTTNLVYANVLERKTLYLTALKNHKEALNTYQKSIVIQEKELDINSLQIAKAYGNLASIYEELRVEHYKKALSLYKKIKEISQYD